MCFTGCNLQARRKAAREEEDKGVAEMPELLVDKVFAAEKAKGAAGELLQESAFFHHMMQVAKRGVWNAEKKKHSIQQRGLERRFHNTMGRCQMNSANPSCDFHLHALISIGITVSVAKSIDKTSGQYDAGPTPYCYCHDCYPNAKYTEHDEKTEQYGN